MARLKFWMNTGNVIMTKADIRRKIRDRRRRLDPDWVNQASDRIQQSILALDAWAATRQVCCYLAAPTEVQTGRIIEAGQQACKQVWVPAFHPEQERYALSRLDHNAVLITGRHRIPEPARPVWLAPDTMDLVLIPGLAFDSHGGRIGHGGGHYDDLLARGVLRSALKVGLAFAFQVRDHVPSARPDVAMDVIVTENAVIRCRAINFSPGEKLI